MDLLIVSGDTLYSLASIDLPFKVLASFKEPLYILEATSTAIFMYLGSSILSAILKTSKCIYV
ncbi:hypothetical protein SDC9_194024 [bioreactor metagenome]|uniref:Uncharacterized protein n=1 Tax=bioreactor metagenome TaxID=1076179 RepID=A0A645I5B1_9ZZZZ